jgi:putative sigma-54 modulation protein
MELHIRNVDTPITEELRSFANRHAAKLDRYFDRAVDGQLELRARPQRSGGEITRVQITIQAGRALLRAEEEDHDPQKAIDRAFTKLLRQVRRFHDRRTDRKAQPPHRSAAFDGLRPLEPEEIDALDALDDGTGDEEPRQGIVRTKRFSLKPMRPDEAVDQMELLGHDFYLFLNADEGQMNVVYRRRDGAFGLLAPEPS